MCSSAAKLALRCKVVVVVVSELVVWGVMVFDVVVVVVVAVVVFDVGAMESSK